jgi:hypothetical protein
VVQRQGERYYGNRKEIRLYLLNLVGCIHYHYLITRLNPHPKEGNMSIKDCDLEMKGFNTGRL